jgi:hypothetical protein
MSQRTAWQLTGYLLLDAAGRYQVDTVGLYLTRSGILTWPRPAPAAKSSMRPSCVRPASVGVAVRAVMTLP